MIASATFSHIGSFPAPQGGRAAAPTATVNRTKSGFLYIRAMRVDDYPRVQALWERHREDTTFPATSCGSVSSFLRCHPGLSFIAEQDGELVGTALCGSEGNTGYVLNLIVEPGSTQQVVRGELVRRCLLYLGAMNISTCHLAIEGDAYRLPVSKTDEISLSSAIRLLAKHCAESTTTPPQARSSVGIKPSPLMPSFASRDNGHGKTEHARRPSTPALRRTGP